MVQQARAQASQPRQQPKSFRERMRQLVEQAQQQQQQPKSWQQGSGASVGNSPWQEARDPTTGRAYYWHAVTRETRWTKPSAAGATPQSTRFHGDVIDV